MEKEELEYLAEQLANRMAKEEVVADILSFKTQFEKAVSRLEKLEVDYVEALTQVNVYKDLAKLRAKQNEELMTHIKSLELDIALIKSSLKNDGSSNS